MPQFVLISDRPLDPAWAQARALVAFSESIFPMLTSSPRQRLPEGASFLSHVGRQPEEKWTRPI